MSVDIDININNEIMAITSKAVEWIVNTKIMPEVIRMANLSFTVGEANELIDKFREQAFICFKKKCYQSAAAQAHINVKVRDNGLVMFSKENILVAVYLDKRYVNLSIATDKFYEGLGNRPHSCNACYYHYNKNRKCGMWGTTNGLKYLMKKWRNQKRKGMLTIDGESNDDYEYDDADDDDPDKYRYSLTMTSMNDNEPDDDETYYFVTKQNRDVCFTYVMF